MKDILIIGGFNWLGFELTKFVINNNMFSNIIIVDVLKDFLLKDNKTKNQFDEYAHLYEQNIFMYNINIKDKGELSEIYKKHNIKSVINNVKFKYNLSDTETIFLLDGYKNIVKFNDYYSISQYIYITRTYTHEKLLFNLRKNDNLIEKNFEFNERTLLINENKGHYVNIPDYIYGNKCYDSNNILYKLTNIIKIKSPIYIPQCCAYFIHDDLLLMIIFELLFTETNEKNVNKVINENISGPHRYIDIFNFFQSTTNNNIAIIETVDEHYNPGIPPQDIIESSLLGKYIKSLN
jgi:extradiol dioxygenase family protein